MDAMDTSMGRMSDFTYNIERNMRQLKREIEPSSDGGLIVLQGHVESVECKVEGVNWIGIGIDSVFGTIVSGSADKTLRVWDANDYGIFRVDGSMFCHFKGS